VNNIPEKFKETILSAFILMTVAMCILVLLWGAMEGLGIPQVLIFLAVGLVVVEILTIVACVLKPPQRD